MSSILTMLFKPNLGPSLYCALFWACWLASKVDPAMLDGACCCCDDSWLTALTGIPDVRGGVWWVETVKGCWFVGRRIKSIDGRLRKKIRNKLTLQFEIPKTSNYDNMWTMPYYISLVIGFILICFVFSYIISKIYLSYMKHNPYQNMNDP